MNRVIAVAGRAVYVHQRRAHAARSLHEALHKKQQYTLARPLRAVSSPRRRLCVKPYGYQSAQCTKALLAQTHEALHKEQQQYPLARPQALHKQQQQYALARPLRAATSSRRLLRVSPYGYHGAQCTKALLAQSAGTDEPSTASPDHSKGIEQHTPVLLSELLDCFRDISLQRFVDGTVGAGGHSAAIIRQHQISMSPETSITGIKRETGLCCRDIVPFLDRTYGMASATANGILLDLGVSSMQVDQPQRGFSFMNDGPLDMRMSQQGESAETLINNADEAYLGQLLRDYGEERAWRSIASRIAAAREEEPILTTRQLVAAIGGRRSPRGKGGSRGIHPATRTFQALRIAVNDELGALTTALPAAIDCLAPGGRLAVISFHSLEDRVVKHAFLKAAGRPHDAEPLPLHLDPRDYPAPVAVAALVTKRPITAGEDEQRANPRSRSAKLRILQKL